MLSQDGRGLDSLDLSLELDFLKTEHIAKLGSKLKYDLLYQDLDPGLGKIILEAIHL